MKNFKIISFIGLFTFFANGQVGINTPSPQTSLDVRAANHLGAVSSKDGVLVPRVNNLSVNGTQNGQLVFLVSDWATYKSGFVYWDGTKWSPIKPANFDVTDDALINNSIQKRVELGTQSDGSTARTLGSEFVIKDTGFLGLGTSSPSTMVEAIGTITSTQNDSWDSFVARTASDNKFSVLSFKRGRGNDVSSQTYAMSGDTLGDVAFKNHTNPSGSEIKGVASENHSSTTSGSEIQILTIKNGDPTMNPDIRMKITNDGKVGILPANSSFGGGLDNNPNSTLQVYGSVSAKIRSLSSGTVADDDYTIQVRGNISLPNASSSNTGRIYYLINDNTGSNTITSNSIRVQGSNNSSYTLNNTDKARAITIQSNGSEWVVVSRF